LISESTHISKVLALKLFQESHRCPPTATVHPGRNTTLTAPSFL
jgi:hypothetical protein